MQQPNIYINTGKVMKRFRSLSSSILSILIPLLSTLLLIVVVIYFTHVMGEVNSNAENRIGYSGMLIRSMMQNIQEKSLESAIFIASNHKVKSAYYIENEEEAVDSLKKFIEPLIDDIKKANNIKNFKVHFHKPPAKSFLRAWTDKRFDNLESFRSTILQVYRTKNYVKGIELGRGGFAIRGLAPVIDGGRYLGSVEVFFTPQTAINLVDADTTGTYAFYLVQKRLAESLFLENEINNNFSGTVGDYYISNTDNTAIEPGELLNDDKLSGSGNGIAIKTDKKGSIFLSYIPVNDYSGKHVGYVVFAKDYADVLSANNRILFILIFVMILLGGIMIYIVFRTISNKVGRPIRVLSKGISAISKGKLNYADSDEEFKNEISKKRNDEIGILVNSVGEITANLNNLTGEVNSLIAESSSGNLDKRGNAQKFENAYKEIIDGFNKTLDQLTEPLKLTTNYVKNIGEGNLPHKIEGNFPGDYITLKENLQFTADSIRNLVEEVNKINYSVEHFRLRETIDTSKFRGDYKKIPEGFNLVLEKILSILDNTDAIFMAMDHDNNIQFISRPAAKILNTGAKSLEGKKCYEVIKSDHCDTEKCPCLKSIKSKENVTVDSRAKIGNQSFDIKTTAIPYTDSSGKVLGSYEIIIDTSEQANSIRKFEKISAFQESQARKINSSLEEFAMGRFDFDLKIDKGDPDTEKSADMFMKIAKAIDTGRQAVKMLNEDTRYLIGKGLEGQLSARADASRHHGEYAKIITGINNILETIINPLEETSRLLGIMASGNFDVQSNSEFRGELKVLSSSIGTLTESISETLRSVMDSIRNTSDSAADISEASESISAATQQQSAQIDEVKSGLEQLNTSIFETAKNAAKTSTFAEQNERLASEGGEIVIKSIEKMRLIAQIVKNYTRSIQELGVSGSRIGEIIEVINDIADQTNLLALNAAIEAARAGEHGRGFAVVADEVRKLAERTTDATKEIEDMIKAIQKQTSDAVREMETGDREVNEGIELADKAGEALKNIVDSSGSVLSMINEIASANEEESSATEQITANLVGFAESVSDTAKRIEEVAGAATELSALTESLAQQVRKFNLKNSQKPVRY